MSDPMVNESKVAGYQAPTRRHSWMNYLTRRCREARGQKGPTKETAQVWHQPYTEDGYCPDKAHLSVPGAQLDVTTRPIKFLSCWTAAIASYRYSASTPSGPGTQGQGHLCYGTPVLSASFAFRTTMDYLPRFPDVSIHGPKCGPGPFKSNRDTYVLMVEAEFRTMFNGLFQIWDRRRSGKYLKLKRPMSVSHTLMLSIAYTLVLCTFPTH